MEVKRLRVKSVHISGSAHCHFVELIKRMKITCNIEMCIAGGLPNFVRDDTLVDTTVCMAHRADDQAVDVTDYKRNQ